MSRKKHWLTTNQIFESVRNIVERIPEGGFGDDKVELKRVTDELGMIKKELSRLREDQN